MSRLPSIPPAPEVLVKLGLRIVHVKYDALDSKLTTRMAVVMVRLYYKKFEACE